MKGNSRLVYTRSEYSNNCSCSVYNIHDVYTYMVNWKLTILILVTYLILTFLGPDLHWLSNNSVLVLFYWSLPLHIDLFYQKPEVYTGVPKLNEQTEKRDWESLRKKVP